MPFKDIIKQRACQNKWYASHKEEHRERTKRNKLSKKEWFREYKKTLKCTRCEERYSYCLDFHHINPKEKEYNIYEMVHRGNSIAEIEKEIAKCIVLCSNCHRKLHNPVE